MQILILTSSRVGTASFCLPLIIEGSGARVAAVIYNNEKVKKNAAFYKRKFKKILKIGLFGTLNGIRMRKWFTKDVSKLAAIDDLELICKKYNIPFYTTEGINNEGTIALFKKADVDLGISLGNSYISKKVFSIPRLGMINLHGELLPQFKNAQSIIWQLYEKSTVTGYTIHEINSKIDDGAILKREEVPIIFRDSLSETVSNSCVQILTRASRGLIEILDSYPAYLDNKISQKGGKSYTTPSFRQFLTILNNFNRLKTRSKNTNVDL